MVIHDGSAGYQIIRGKSVGHQIIRDDVSYYCFKYAAKHFGIVDRGFPVVRPIPGINATVLMKFAYHPYKWYTGHSAANYIYNIEHKNWDIVREIEKIHDIKVLAREVQQYSRCSLPAITHFQLDHVFKLNQDYAFKAAVYYRDANLAGLILGAGVADPFAFVPCCVESIPDNDCAFIIALKNKDKKILETIQYTLKRYNRAPDMRQINIDAKVLFDLIPALNWD